MYGIGGVLDEASTAMMLSFVCGGIVTKRARGWCPVSSLAYIMIISCLLSYSSHLSLASNSFIDSQRAVKPVLMGRDVIAQAQSGK